MTICGTCGSEIQTPVFAVCWGCVVEDWRESEQHEQRDPNED